MTLSMTIRLNIARRRRQLGLSQATLARRLGHRNGGMVSMIESGERELTPIMLARLAVALETTPAELIKYHDGWPT